MTVTQIVRYLENRDAPTITYRRFNRTPRDRYPTYSVCLHGSSIYWYHDVLLYNTFGTTSEQFVETLKGVGWRYEYNSTSRLYTKSPMFFSNHSKLDFTEFTIDPVDIFLGVEFLALNSKHNIQYGTASHVQVKHPIPFYIGHLTPDTICFTRNSTDELGLTRVYDLLSLKRSLLSYGTADNVELQVIVHHPGQLMRSLDMPNFKSTLSTYNKEKVLEMRISHVTTLRKRPDSNDGCNDKIQDDDASLRMIVAKNNNCVPPYWKHVMPNITALDVCNTPVQLKNVFDYMENDKDAIFSTDPPCVDMTQFVAYNWNLDQPDTQFLVKVIYTDKYYQEIENMKDFSFETFWSSVGGFVGIFLGYSMMQFPDMVWSLVSVAKSKLRQKISAKIN